MGEMSDIERLVAIEDIKRLKSRRDRTLDMRDFATFEALHAPDHHSDIEGFGAWTTAAELVANISKTLNNVTSIHHSHTPDITFESRDKALTIWAMEDTLVWMQGDEEHWLRGYGFYYETCERRNGEWVFTRRRLERLRVELSPGAVYPPNAPPGQTTPAKPGRHN